MRKKLSRLFKREPFWKELWLSESEKAFWEINHNNLEKKVNLLYVPNEQYSQEDVNIPLTYEEFEDLIGFINKLKSKR